MIEFNQVSLQRGTNFLLEKASLRIHDGQKLALIGPNGAGKSSLFALLNGELTVDGGDLNMPAKWRIAHMKQEVEASERCALDYAIDGDARYREIEAGMANASDDNALTRWMDAMDEHQGYQIPVKAEQLLHGLGFSQADLKRSVKDFSGGWRIRLNLAQALMMPSDLLLLDEPTNHLDLEATLWLEGWLKKYPGTLLFISHDRDFIDSVADHIVHLHNRELVVYPGNYSAYERIRAEKLAQQQTVYEKQQERVAEIEKFVARFRAKASKAKQAQSRLKELQRMELIAPAHVDSPFRFEFPCYEKMSTPLLAIDNADLGYADKTILPQVKISIVPGHRIGLLGPNGAGKSTLLKTLCEEVPLLAGERSTGEHCHIGYFAQHQLESLDVKASGSLILQRLRPQASEQEIRNFLGGFGFHGDKALEVIEPFSGGEKARMALACVAWMKPNLLILDEPTIGLDPHQIVAVRELIKTLAEDHTVLISSHILPEVEVTCNRLLIMHRGELLAADTQTNLQQRVGGVSRVVAELVAPENELREVLDEMGEVTDYRLTSTSGEYRRCVLTARDGVDLRPRVAKLARVKGWALRELSESRPTLEDIFVQLTRPDEEGEIF